MRYVITTDDGSITGEAEGRLAAVAIARGEAERSGRDLHVRDTREDFLVGTARPDGWERTEEGGGQ